MYVCMYVCMHTCIHVCMRACMHACMHACMYGCMHAWVILLDDSNHKQRANFNRSSVIETDTNYNWLFAEPSSTHVKTFADFNGCILFLVVDVYIRQIRVSNLFKSIIRPGLKAQTYGRKKLYFLSSMREQFTNSIKTN